MHDEKELERARERVKKLRSFYSNVVTYCVVNVILVVINLLTSPHDLWFWWVTLIWGAVLVVQAINTFTIRNKFLGEEWEEKKVQEILDKKKRDRK